MVVERQERGVDECAAATGELGPHDQTQRPSNSLIVNRPVIVPPVDIRKLSTRYLRRTAWLSAVGLTLCNVNRPVIGMAPSRRISSVLIVGLDFVAPGGADQVAVGDGGDRHERH